MKKKKKHKNTKPTKRVERDACFYSKDLKGAEIILCIEELKKLHGLFYYWYNRDIDLTNQVKIKIETIEDRLSWLTGKEIKNTLLECIY